MAKVILTAPRCRILYDGVKVAKGTNIVVNEAYEIQDTVTIDELEVVEHPITGYTVTGTIGTVGCRNENMRTRNFLPQVGKDSQEHLLNVILKEEGQLVLLDKATPAKKLMTIIRVTFGASGWNLAAGGLVGHDVEWRGIRLRDHSETA
jgi:hypothetical protein